MKAEAIRVDGRQGIGGGGGGGGEGGGEDAEKEKRAVGSSYFLFNVNYKHSLGSVGARSTCINHFGATPWLFVTTQSRIKVNNVIETKAAASGCPLPW